jgi:hypothetical protein
VAVASPFFKAEKQLVTGHWSLVTEELKMVIEHGTVLVDQLMATAPS